MNIHAHVPEFIPKLFRHPLEHLYRGIVSFDAVHAYVPPQLHRQFHLSLEDPQLMLKWDGEPRKKAWGGVVVVWNPDCAVQTDFAYESVGETQEVLPDF